MKKVTITLDAETARRARAHAARRKISLSRFVGEVLREHMRESSGYAQAMRRYLDSDLVIHRQADERPARDELHDR
jgi:hypothetical protein